MFAMFLFPNLRNENAMLHAKIDELNACKPSTSSVDHVTICTRCRDINVDAVHDHLALIKKQSFRPTDRRPQNACTPRGTKH
jgi:hypothetical protein